MKQGYALLVCLVLFAGCVPLPTPQGDLTPNGTPTATPATTNDPFEQNRRLGRGVNLGNALEAPNEGEWGVVLSEEYFALIKEAGFDSVRIPIRWSAHARKTPPYTIEPAFFARVDWAVNQALSRGLLAIINVHHYEEMASDPRGHRERFLALWEQIADHYRDYPPELLFELMNEPNGALQASLWNDLVEEALPVIRATNPARNVIVGPVNWYNISSLYSLKLPADDAHLIASFHYYEPFQFTHQGAEWVSGSNAWLGTKWEGTESERRAVERDLDLAATWAEKNHRPLYLGEFGAYSKAGMDSRARWTDYIARQAEARGMSWAYWEFCAGFGVYDPVRRRWNEPLLSALIPPGQ
jgi:endoglucanase